MVELVTLVLFFLVLGLIDAALINRRRHDPITTLH